MSVEADADMAAAYFARLLERNMSHPEALELTKTYILTRTMRPADDMFARLSTSAKRPANS